MNRNLVNEFAKENDGQCIVVRLMDDTICVTTDPPGIRCSWDYYFTAEPESFDWDRFGISH